MEEKRQTVGSIAANLMKKEPESTDPIELERAMQEDYIDNLIQCVNDGKKLYAHDFFVVVLTKRERLMSNVFRNYFLHRKTCPTPNYDQTLFKYNSADDSIEYVWTIPSQDTCHHLKDNALYVHPDERNLLQFVLSFADGSLFKLAKQLNGEKELTSPVLEGV